MKWTIQNDAGVIYPLYVSPLIVYRGKLYDVKDIMVIQLETWIDWAERTYLPLFD